MRPCTTSGAVIWLTGIPASGKSTLAHRVYLRLRDEGVPVELLDESDASQPLWHDSGLRRDAREEAVKRIGYVAKLLARNGVVAICASVSPLRATRAALRREVTHFLEVYVDCPLEVAERRDPNGSYARARLGLIPNFVGISAPHERPLDPELHIRSDWDDPEESIIRIVGLLERRSILRGGHRRRRAGEHPPLPALRTMPAADATSCAGSR